MLTTSRRTVTLIAIALCFSVILIGAYTRLKDAGLGCPDWPGCYGQLTAPETEDAIALAQKAYPGMQVETQKAKIEMTHRYFASSLGLLICFIFFSALISRTNKKLSRKLAIGLLGLVIFQGLLGMWTVTLKLLPLVVMAHLLGGITTLSLLWSLWLSEKDGAKIKIAPSTFKLLNATLVMVCIQIALGGWTSANYAALICPDFPFCMGHQLGHFSLQAFNFWGAFPLDNPLSFMSLEARMTIQMAHRFGALILTCLLGGLCFSLWRHTPFISSDDKKKVKRFILLAMGLLCSQIILGITNVLALLPISVAVAHNGIAVLLLLSIITMHFYFKPTGG